MTRRLPIFSPDRISAVVAVQREHNAEADASRQVLEWLARAHVEEGR